MQAQLSSGTKCLTFGLNLHLYIDFVFTNPNHNLCIRAAKALAGLQKCEYAHKRRRPDSLNFTVRFFMEAQMGFHMIRLI